jgi:hypothetical protein
MRLIDLEPQFVRYECRTETWTRVLGDPLAWKPGDPTEQVTGSREYHVEVDSLAEAQGIMFTCPKCYLRDPKGFRGGHMVLCWFMGRDVPDGAQPGPGRWVPSGTGYLDLTFGHPSGSSSVALTPPGCGSHFHINNGGVIMTP